MQAPRLFTLLVDKVDGAVGGVDGLRMFFGHPCGFAGVAHMPAAEHFAVLTFGGVGPFVPRVAAVVAVITQVLGVGRGLALILEQRAVGVDAVVTQIRIETDLIEWLGLGTVGVDLQALQGLKVRRGVGLAHQCGADAMGAQVVSDR